MESQAVECRGLSRRFGNRLAVSDLRVSGSQRRRENDHRPDDGRDAAFLRGGDPRTGSRPHF